jgi:ABC-type multidrug transport system fused ATPase/permease subunit
VLASLRGLTPAITVINIAHRISSINLSDIIAVMEGGYIVEIGEPSELMKREGHYYKIVTSSS